jgi:alpha-tubulin suppressor-like RCC1 family protein
VIQAVAALVPAGKEVTPMNARMGSRSLARVTGSAALVLGLVGGAVAGSGAVASAGSTPVKARPGLIFPMRSAAAGWGNNYAGQLGNGVDFQIVSPNWTAVSGLSGVVQVAAGDDQSVALTSDGSVWDWGFVNLGSGTAHVSTVPEQVPSLTGITKVATHDGEDLALRSDGTVWAWGDNAYGDLGDGTTVPRDTPVQVSGLTSVTQIAAGGSFGLALRSNGTVWSWGYNGDGELGNGTTDDSSVPVQVKGLSQVTKIAAGQTDSMAVATRGITTLTSVYAWGANGQGQIGDGTSRERPVPVQITGIGVPNVIAISVGNDYSMVLGSDGTLWDWGLNQWGQLGNGTITSANKPVEAEGLESGITQISAGDSHSLALLSDGSVEAWGYNGAGQLGDGSSAFGVANPAPVQVVGLGNVTQISAGASFSLAIHQVPFSFEPRASRASGATGSAGAGTGASK